ncbi:hypothetical protein A1351_21080 [Methylosinus sp. R-45379]|uniref:hypothetical protein n=1 Tax=Methylosinus sp. R-45379 TaxID=980563 RepID=UPI0007C95FA5|nr:hypothetical protein [Methylosinus sp. R-45379]OAI31625.1 hypothetical protein A1351_21080 [Methylosinus sp. R-45379]
MIHLLRALIPMLALASLLLGAAPLARAGHGCEGMSAAAMEDCHKAAGDRGSVAADDCAAVSCAQISPVATPNECSFLIPAVTAKGRAIAASDADFASLTGSPELRPPIA